MDVKFLRVWAKLDYLKFSTGANVIIKTA